LLSITTPVPWRSAPSARELRASRTARLFTLTTESASTVRSPRTPPGMEGAIGALCAASAGAHPMMSAAPSAMTARAQRMRSSIWCRMPDFMILTLR
jgi:hypothetical protein